LHQFHFILSSPHLGVSWRTINLSASQLQSIRWTFLNDSSPDLISNLTKVDFYVFVNLSPRVDYEFPQNTPVDF